MPRPSICEALAKKNLAFVVTGTEKNAGKYLDLHDDVAVWNMMCV